MTADLARANHMSANVPMHSFNNKGMMTVNEDRIKIMVNTASNMNKAIITFESRYKIESLSQRNLESYNTLKADINRFKADSSARIKDFKASIDKVETCAKMISSDTIAPIFNTMLNKYNKLKESPVRQSPNLDNSIIETSLSNILDTKCSTSGTDAEISERGDAAGQIIKRFLSSSRTVHISDASIAKLEQPAFNDYMNQRLQELPADDRELTLSLYKAFATLINRNEVFDKDFSSTFFGQGVVTGGFINSFHAEQGSFKRDGQDISFKELCNSTYEKFLAYVETTNSPIKLVQG